MKAAMTLLLTVAVLLMVGCEGAQGPAGPTGPQGPTGPAGEDGEPGVGTRVVYKSITPLYTNAVQCYAIPEIDTDDMPLVSVYAAPTDYPDMWAELPVWNPQVSQTMWYSISDGQICVEMCMGYWIMVVVVV